MEERDFIATCARINASLDIKEYVAFLDYHPERAIKSQGLYRMLCPLHGETVFRTLVLNPRRNTAHCEHSGCDGHRPCDLIELAMKVYRKTREEIVLMMLDHFGQERLQLTNDLVEQLRQLEFTMRARPENDPPTM